MNETDYLYTHSRHSRAGSPRWSLGEAGGNPVFVRFERWIPDRVGDDKKRGFTLIELLVVIAVIATVIAFAVPNFLGARQRAGDAKKKSEMQQFKQALRLYYNDYNSYPTDNTPGPLYNVVKGCGVNGTGTCPGACTVDFAAGGAGCDVVYMKKFPSDFGTSMYYYRGTNTDDFCLKVPLDNTSDGEIAKSQTKCATPCTGKVSGTDYAVCAD